jgi:hypothetical protein
MGSTYGRQVLESWGLSIQVCADSTPEWKPGGVTIDWGTVAAAGADVNLEDGFFTPAGEKYLRYGQVLTRLTIQPAQLITVTGGPTGGTFTLTGTRPDTGVTSTQTVAFNAAVAATQTAMDAMFGAGNTLVTGAGALPANAHTVTFQGGLINYAPALMTASGAGLTGGTTPAVAVTVPAGQAGGNYGWWGPYDPAASDGRQTLTKGDCFILNTSVRETGDPASNHPPALRGGLLWKKRILMTTGTHSLANGPTVAEFEAVFPRVFYANF